MGYRWKVAPETRDMTLYDELYHTNELSIDPWHQKDTFEPSVNTPCKPLFAASILPVAHRGTFVPLHFVATTIKPYTHLRFLTSPSLNPGKQMLRKIIGLMSLR